MGNRKPNYILRIDKQEIPLACEDDLLPYLYLLLQTEHAEARLLRGDRTISLLTNRGQKKAFLMFLPEGDPAGFHTVCDCDAGEEIEFLLDNGQVDSFACQDTVGLHEGLRAFRYFFAHGGMAPFLSWRSGAPGMV